MKRRVTLLVMGFYLFGCFHHSEGATTATATATYTISTIAAISISGNPAPLNITSTTAGSSLPNATDSSTTYSVTTNQTARRVTGALATTMPVGITLTVNLTAPTGGTSAGAVALTTTAQSLVTGIANVAQGGMAITYVLSATLSAVPVSAATNTLTYTIGP